MPHIPRENHHSMYVLHKIASPAIKICIVMQWNERKPKAFSKPLHNYAFSLQKKGLLSLKKVKTLWKFCDVSYKKVKGFFQQSLCLWNLPLTKYIFSKLFCLFEMSKIFVLFGGNIFSPFLYPLQKVEHQETDVISHRIAGQTIGDTSDDDVLVPHCRCNHWYANGRVDQCVWGDDCCVGINAK